MIGLLSNGVEATDCLLK